MDGRRFIETVFASQEAQPITQVVMNLPQDAAEFLGMQRRIRLLVFFQLFHLYYNLMLVHPCAFATFCSHLGNIILSVALP